MKSLIAISSMFLIVNLTTAFTTIKDPETLKIKCTEQSQEICAFVTQFSYDLVVEPSKIEDIKVYEVEEEVQIDFATKDYLPCEFNPLKGLGDLDWNTIELIEIEEEIEFDFDTKECLPINFNPYVDM